jgi:hypothetical protein
MRKYYEVTVHTEYNNDFIWDLRCKYNKQFSAKRHALEYGRSIKKELKELCVELCKGTNHVICLDVERYYVYDDTYEERDGLIYSWNIVGKY